MSEQNIERTGKGRVSAGARARIQSSPLADLSSVLSAESGAAGRLAPLDTSSAFAFSESLRKTLPSIVDVAISAGKPEARKIVVLFELGKALVKDYLDSIEAQPRRVAPATSGTEESRQSELVIARKLYYDIENLYERAERVSVLSPGEFERPLTREQEGELSRALTAYRHAFWLKLYEVPFIRDEALAQLRRVAEQAVQPETEIFTKRSDPRTQEQLVAQAADAVAKISLILGKREVDLTPRDRSLISSYLAALPLRPERLVLHYADAKREFQELGQLERTGAQLSEREAELRYRLGGGHVAVSRRMEELAVLVEPYFAIRNYMAVCNSGLALAMARKVGRNYEPLREDLGQVGHEGVLHGVERFDESLGFKLSTALVPWAEQRGGRFLGRYSHVVDKPAHISELVMRLNHALLSSEGPLSDAELAKRLGTSADHIASLRPLATHAASLDFSIKGEEGDLDCSPAALLADPRGPEHQIGLDKDDLTRRIKEELDRVADPRLREIVGHRFGLDGKPPKTLDEVGKIYGITRERVRQLEAKVLARLRENPRLKDLFTSLAE
jgi:RNA polymerase primary sigma factor